MDQATKKNTLKSHKLRTTACREDVLEVFMTKNTALSHGDIENELVSEFDRVTIYRTLKSFLEKGIIHKVLDDEGVRYALCQDNCSDDHHQHDHVHFKCTNCGETNCIQDVEVPALRLPAGYESREVNLLIQGICPTCH
jgi:Fur family ferric uptake transcriptional regulator